MKNAIDDVLKQTHYVAARENELISTLVKALRDAESDILGKQIALQNRYLTDASFERHSFSRRKAFYEAQQTEITNLLNELYGAMQGGITDALHDVMSYVAIKSASLIPKTILANPDIFKLSMSQVTAYIEVNTVEGFVLSEWLSDMASSSAKKIIKAGRTALIEGMTFKQTANIIKKEGIEGSIPQIEGLARTYLMSGANHARELTLTELLQDIDFQWQFIATLDGRTCLVCGANDKTLYKKDAEKPSLPIHRNCRCVYVPYFSDSLLPESERPSTKHDERTVHHRDGSTSTKFTVSESEPTTENYSQWMTRQLEDDPDFVRGVLGKTRFELFSKGEISLEKMVADSKILSLKELL